MKTGIFSFICATLLFITGCLFIIISTNYIFVFIISLGGAIIELINGIYWRNKENKINLREINIQK